MKHNIINNPQHYYLLQFHVENNKLIPHRANPFHTKTSPKNPQHPFASPQASKFGINKHRDATHWAIVYAPNNNTPKIIYQSTFDSITTRKVTIPFNNGTTHWLNVRGTNHYFTVYISTQSNIVNTKNTKKATTA